MFFLIFFLIFKFQKVDVMNARSLWTQVKRKNEKNNTNKMKIFLLLLSLTFVFVKHLLFQN